MKKYRFRINNLDCASCAMKVESALNECGKYKNVVVNFSASKVSLECDEEVDLEHINEVAKNVEPEVDIEVIQPNKVDNKKFDYSIVVYLIALILGVFGVKGISDVSFINIFLIGFSYVLLVYKHFINAIKVLFRNKSVNEDFLIVISSLGAFVVGETFEGIMVLALYSLGKYLEEKAINKTRSSVKDLLDIKQDFANLKVEDEIKKVDVNEIKVGDILVIKKGEKIPVDGVVISGSSNLDTSALTGESDLVSVTKGSKVLSGAINAGDIIEMRAEEVYENSTVSRILTLIDEATDKKSKTETTVTKVSKIYTPAVIVLAFLVALLLPILFDIPYADSIYRGLTFLVISCPCAIAISVPLAYFVGIEIASKNKILIKGSNYLDNLKNLKKIVFDKTGTITTGAFKVSNIEIFDDKYSKEEVVDILTKGEALSNHPIAKSIMKLAKNEINSDDIEMFTEIEGRGISFELQGKKVIIGAESLCNDCTLEANVHLNIDGKHVASIIIDDGIKKNAKEAISKLHKLGIKTYMFTGDQSEIANEIAKEVGIDEVKSEMLPVDKFNEYENLSKDDERVAFVGDGVNDAPVLKRAYIGMSMGEIGSAAAIEASDVVLMKDDLLKIPEAIKISKKTNKIIKQNLVFAFAVKITCLLLSVLGVATMWMAVFADTGVTVLTVLNTLRLRKLCEHKHEHEHAHNHNHDSCSC